MRAYYEANPEKLIKHWQQMNDRNKQRYREDPEFREGRLRYRRERYLHLKKARELARAIPLVPHLLPIQE